MSLSSRGLSVEILPTLLSGYGPRPSGMSKGFPKLEDVQRFQKVEKDMEERRRRPRKIWTEFSMDGQEVDDPDGKNPDPELSCGCGSGGAKRLFGLCCR